MCICNVGHCQGTFVAKNKGRGESRERGIWKVEESFSGYMQTENNYVCNDCVPLGPMDTHGR